MAITKYVDKKDGKEYWRASAHARSVNNRSVRIQRAKFKLDSEIQARREEKKLIKEVERLIAKKDCKGLIWGDILHLWKQDKKDGLMGEITERSLNDYMSILHHWTKPWNMRIASDLTRADGRDIVKRMTAKKSAPRYIKKVKNLIDKVFNWGIEEGYIIGGINPPCKGINIGSVESKTPEVLSLGEIKKLLSAAQLTNNIWYSVWSMALLTGMRSGELFALSWEQVDLEKGTILVDRSYDANVKTIGPTKGRYWRTVPISSDLRKLLLDLQNNHGFSSGEHVLPRIKEWENGDQAVSLRNFLKSIGVKDVKFHALRACWATQMLANGVPAAIVMKIGGWKKMATMDIYVRLAGVEVKGATDCLNFVPSEIDYSENVISLSDFKKEV